MKPIDWSAFDKYPEQTCECHCGAIYRTHTKYVTGIGLVARKPCPGCGKFDNLRSARGETEVFTLKR